MFTTFRETKFLKDYSDFDKNIKLLKEIKSKYPFLNNIDKDIKLLEKGLYGEEEIKYELKNTNLGMYVLHDVNLGYNDLNAQIDFIIITKAYVYLVECKNLIGNITINENGEFRREYFYNNKKIIEGIYSPFNQAMRHKEILRKIWLSKNNKINQILYEKSFDRIYKPLIVLSNSKSMLNKKYAPKKIKDIAIRSDELIEYIKNDIDKCDNKYYLSKKNMLDIANSILKLNIKKENFILAKYQEKVKKLYNVKMNLKTYRKNKAQKNNIPAYYIFTDNELEKILMYMPKSIDELKQLNILNDIKINLHGKEIINILSNEERKN